VPSSPSRREAVLLADELLATPLCIHLPVDDRKQPLQTEPLRYAEVWLGSAARTSTRLGFVNVAYNAAGVSDLPALVEDSKALLQAGAAAPTPTTGNASRSGGRARPVAAAPQAVQRLQLHPERVIRRVAAQTDISQRARFSSPQRALTMRKRSRWRRFVIADSQAIVCEALRLFQARAVAPASERARSCVVVCSRLSRERSDPSSLTACSRANFASHAQALCHDRAAANELRRREAMAGRRRSAWDAA
jgi:hypothetical protein